MPRVFGRVSQPRSPGHRIVQLQHTRRRDLRQSALTNAFDQQNSYPTASKTEAVHLPS